MLVLLWVVANFNINRIVRLLVYDLIDEHLICQIESIVGYKNRAFKGALKKTLPYAVERHKYCMSYKVIKHIPTHISFHADEYAAFLYFFSNELYKRLGENVFAEKIYLLNRYLNSLDIFYDRELPDIFHLEHPIGTIIGRAKLSNYLEIYQGVTIGGNLQLEMPDIGENVSLYAGATIIGKTKIGCNCSIGSGVTLLNEIIENNSTVINTLTPIRIKNKKDNHNTQLFRKKK